jgi:hypothetical protein
MSYRNEGCEGCTSSEIERWIENTEYQVQQHIKTKGAEEIIKILQKQLDDLRADLILKKQEEAKAEMKQLLSRLLQLVDST